MKKLFVLVVVAVACSSCYGCYGYSCHWEHDSAENTNVDKIVEVAEPDAHVNSL